MNPAAQLAHDPSMDFYLHNRAKGSFCNTTFHGGRQPSRGPGLFFRCGRKLPSSRPELSFLCATETWESSPPAPQRDETRNGEDQARRREYQTGSRAFFCSRAGAGSAHFSPFAGQCQRHSRTTDPPRRRQFSPGAAAPGRPIDAWRSLLVYQRTLFPRQARVCQGLCAGSAKYARRFGDYGLRRLALSRDAANQRRVVRHFVRACVPIRGALPHPARARCASHRSPGGKPLRGRSPGQYRHTEIR